MAQAFDKSRFFPEPGLLPEVEPYKGLSDLAQAAAVSLRRRVLDDLRARIHKIESDAAMTARSVLPGRAYSETHRPEDQETGPTWRLGAAEIDALLGRGGLEASGVHEVKPAVREQGASWAASWAAAFVFSLALAVRRCMSDSGSVRSILCCRPAALANELGGLYGPGLRALGLAPECFIIVETANAADTLWAMEEGLRSRSLALVLGLLDSVALTPARRLALAAATHRTPCLLLTHPRSEAAAATATRWRVGPLPSAPHPFDPHAPGALRFTVDLERCRARPLSAETASFSLEWCDEALCFRLAPGMADRADAARRSGRRTR